MSPQTNSAFQRDDENEYKALSFKEGEPRKSTIKVKGFFLFPSLLEHKRIWGVRRVIEMSYR